MASPKKLTLCLKSPERPFRDPDYVSKRGVHYWWSPDWCRGTSRRNNHFGKIRAIKNRGTVELYMQGKTGKLTYIQGSIQYEFKRWHEDRRIDYMILGENPEDIDDIILNEE